MNRDDATHHPVEALSASIDGELQGPERRALEEHLAACAGCRDLLEDLRTIDRSVAAEPVPPAPADLAGRIAAALPRRAGEPAVMPPAMPAAPPRPWFRAPMPLAAAASLMVATLVWLAWPGGRPMAPEPAGEIALLPQSPAPPPSMPPSAPAPASPESAADAVAPPGPEPVARPTEARPRKAQATARANAVASGSPVTDGDIAFAAPPPGKETASMQNADAGALAPHPESEETLRQVAEQRAVAERSRRDSAPGSTPAPAEAGTVAHGFSGAVPEAGIAEAVDRLSTPKGSWPALRAEPFSVRLLASNTMWVESGEYVCVVAIVPEDAQLLADQYEALRIAQVAPSGQAGRADDPAASAPAAARPQAGSDVRPVPQKAAAREPAAITLEASPEARALILRLVRERYREALEERCGPLPH